LNFNETVFLKALTERPETVKIMSQVFQPEWLQTAEYQPILQEIYKFTKEYNTPPSVSVLHEVFEAKDKALYDTRFKPVLEEINQATTEISDTLYVIDKAKDVAISRSFMDMVNNPVFTEMNNEHDGGAQIKEIEKWMRKFKTDTDDLDLDLKEAHTMLLKIRSEAHASGTSERIPCGMGFIDQWSGGGLRPKNLAIALAPTGHGKSHFLTIVAHNISKQGKNVLFISNELSMEEMTERFISRVTGERLEKIMDDPSLGTGLKRHWTLGLHKRLRLLEVNREISSDEIEALIQKYSFAYGWRPEVIVIDFIERMKPTVTGVKRDQSWNWIGYIAKDLVRMAKRGNWLVWTAGQTNRRGYSSHEEQSLDHAQGSVQHLQEAALVVAFRQRDDYPLEDPNKIMIQFKPLKMRQSKKPGSSILVEADLGRINITSVVRDAKDWLTDEKEEAGPFPNGKVDKDKSN
jgi:replicative DNA helicase